MGKASGLTTLTYTDTTPAQPGLVDSFTTAPLRENFHYYVFDADNADTFLVTGDIDQELEDGGQGDGRWDYKLFTVEDAPEGTFTGVQPEPVQGGLLLFDEQSGEFFYGFTKGRLQAADVNADGEVRFGFGFGEVDGQGDIVRFIVQIYVDNVCLLAGTRIAVPGGDRPVERLRPGHLVLTAEGDIAPVRWVGRREVCAIFGAPEALQLVRVRAGALGDGLPLRDLTLTPDHALLIDGLLINAGALVNGSSIDWVPLSELGDSYTVYHVETEDHDIILAEGAPAETFIDYVQRRAFDNYAEYLALYGEERTITEMPYPRISAVRLLPPQIRARLAGRAAA